MPAAANNNDYKGYANWSAEVAAGCFNLCNMQLNVARDNCMACVDDSVTTAEQIDVERQ